MTSSTKRMTFFFVIVDVAEGLTVNKLCLKLGGNNPPKSSILSVSNIPANGLLAVVVVYVVPGAFVGGGRFILNPGNKQAEI